MRQRDKEKDRHSERKRQIFREKERQTNYIRLLLEVVIRTLTSL